MNEKVGVLVKKMEYEYGLFHHLLGERKIDTSDEYKKINYAYFRIFATHYEGLNRNVSTSLEPTF
ncbi:hypothetical protein GCM10011502_30280 [Oceanisphaera marina]|uniref:Uncharacterized protein n=1 Tax=Oceanisphaera marina TaxID=2017550 RepID=A0ABQ1IXU8_9GAMM|nr:hypothetical protein GCM10011502_30280 [Oceanisphaera marina]